MLCFLLVPLYASTRTPSKGTCAKPLIKHKETVINRLKMEKAAVKWYLSIQVQFKKEKNEETVAPHFRGKCQLAIKTDNIETGFQDSVKKIHQAFTDYQRQGSNWVLDHVIELTIHMVQYQPLRGSSYIHLPNKLRLKTRHHQRAE